MDIKLSQEELKIIVGLLSQVQLVFKDSRVVNPLLERLDSYIEKPKPEDIVKQEVKK